ncbi:helix-turn-helix transcriptional regulator [Cellulomonas phragmiteti]|uniref:LuxR family transcriptional regulator n=1 Tax=Cellulomonas phragmiteti TaxID=478780 RepID=A0ABQ4DNE3_9CELL|nr:helix-turn-helix transcriptional regulator [Cellulomonas phragmiteti]GIG40863.1 LuxR family transcriptional regulator [Cellulomonas phragmiteti]
MSTPFVARAEQVARLRQALDGARAGAPSLVLLGADAGVGKTRLLRHVGQTVAAEGARVVTGHCVDLGEIGLPYLPFSEVLGALRALDPDAVAGVVAARPALGRLLGAGASGAEIAPPVSDADERRELFEGVVEVLTACASADRPLLLVLEDLHWADASSRDLLRFVVSRLAAQPLVVVATYRTDDLHRRHPWRPVAAELARHPRSTHLPLAPFRGDELREFATAVAGRPLPEALLHRVRERAEGNAYFTEELIEAGAGTDALPWSLADVLRTRVERLDAATVRLVQLASVAGRRVAEPLLRAAAQADPATGPAPVDAALREAVTQHVLVVEDDHIAFRHALLAEAVYADLLPGEAAAAHRAFLVALGTATGPGVAAQRATHALRVPDLPVALTASWEAARQAHQVLAPAEELRHLEVVLRLWDAVPDVAATLPDPHAAVLRLAAGAASRAGESERAVQLARASLAAAGDDPVARAGARVVVARHLLSVEDCDGALTEAATALDALPEGPSPERAWALATYARAALNLGREDEAEEVATRAAQVAREVGASAAESDALTTTAVAERRDHERSTRLLTEALARATPTDDHAIELRIRFNLTTTAYYAGDLARAAAEAAAGSRRAQELGMMWASHGVDLRMLDALVRFVRGDLSATPAPDAEDAPGYARALVAAADLYAATARGDTDVVERAAALEAWWSRDALVALAAGGNAVDALTWQGRATAARAQADRVDAHLRTLWSPEYLGGIWLTALALAALADEAAARRSAGDDVTDLLDQADARLARVEHTAEHGRPRGGRLGPEGRAWLARARAEHARAHGSAAPDLWRAAVAELAYGHRYETARTRWRLAEALLAAGDRAGAGDEARAALGEARAMGATPLVDAVEDLLRRARLGAGPASGAPGATVLTAREAEVLALVAQGLSNRQVGERLFISGKTVSVHVSNLLAKLGASGRTEAVTIAHERGLLGRGPLGEERVSAPGPTV